MSWIEPFRDAILAQMPRLQQNNFSWIGEDETLIQFTDGDILLKFVAERYDHWLGVWVRHLGDAESDQSFRLDLVMQVVDGVALNVVDAGNLDEWKQVVARYVDYVLDNKVRLFGPRCSYAAAYQASDRSAAELAMAQWSRKP